MKRISFSTNKPGEQIKKLQKKKVLLFLAFLALAVGGLVQLSSTKKTPEEKEQVSEVITTLHEMTGDFDGDGELEYIELSSSEEGLRSTTSITVKELNGDVIGDIPEGISINSPMDDTFQVFQLADGIDKDFFSFDFIAGPHQFERMFFELHKDKVLPICLTNDVTGPYDCLFYTSRADGFIIKDLDSGGFVEIVETREEYPSEGELSEEEQQAIDQAFGEQDVSEFTEGAAKIARREKGGRGRPVAWAIYSYDGKIFNKQEGDGFDRLFFLLTEEYPDMIAKADLSQESLEYNEFVRNFWSKN